PATHDRSARKSPPAPPTIRRLWSLLLTRTATPIVPGAFSLVSSRYLLVVLVDANGVYWKRRSNASVGHPAVLTVCTSAARLHGVAPQSWRGIGMDVLVRLHDWT